MATFCDGIVQNIERTECIGNSLVKINSNFAGLEAAGCDLENELQSEIANLLSLINTLSSDMKEEPALFATLSSVQTGTIITSQPAVLLAVHVPGPAGTGYNDQVLVKSGTTPVLFVNNLASSNGLAQGAPCLPPGGIKCPQGITVDVPVKNSPAPFYTTIAYRNI